MSRVFIVLRCGDHDRVDVMGVYTTKKEAVKKILFLLKMQYETNDVDDNDRRRFGKRWFGKNDNDPLPVWNDFKQYFKNQLEYDNDKDSKCSPLYIHYYDIQSAVLY